MGKEEIYEEGITIIRRTVKIGWVGKLGLNFQLNLAGIKSAEIVRFLIELSTIISALIAKTKRS